MQGSPLSHFGGGLSPSRGRVKVGQCDVGLRVRLEAGHGVFTGGPGQWSVLPLPSLTYLGAAGVDPGGAQGYGSAVGFLQEHYVTWFVPHTSVWDLFILWDSFMHQL